VVLAVPLVSVVFPVAESVPEMVVLPPENVPVVAKFPAVSCPAIPAPPETVNAPVDVLELMVVLLMAVNPVVLRDARFVFPAESVPEVERLPAVT